MAEQSLKDIKHDMYLTLHKVRELVGLAEDAFSKNKLSSLSQADELAQEIQAKEVQIIASLAKMAATNEEARSLLVVPSHIKSIATSTMRLIENIRKRIKGSVLFTDKAITEAHQLFTSVQDALKKAGDAAVTGEKAIIESVIAISDAIARMTIDFSTLHEVRLVNAKCCSLASSTYLDMLHAFEDMSMHLKSAMKKFPGK